MTVSVSDAESLASFAIAGVGAVQARLLPLSPLLSAFVLLGRGGMAVADTLLPRPWRLGTLPTRPSPFPPTLVSRGRASAMTVSVARIRFTSACPGAIDLRRRS
ncbi:hypothetical protein [Kibdelosporangium philippinense]|uniref:hypothetical protein n=1 Tax=Kibdelosporangium philippinense TaxID=211113 RepID=UPI00361335E7